MKPHGYKIARKDHQDRTYKIDEVFKEEIIVVHRIKNRDTPNDHQEKKENNKLQDLAR